MRKLFQRLCRNERGNVAATFAIAAIPVVGVMGIAIDYSRSSRAQVDLQAAVDASALGGAAEISQASISQTVDAIMNASVPGGVAANGVTYTLDIGVESLTVAAQQDMPTTVSALFRDNIPVAVSATAAFGEPVRIVELQITNFNSDAWDANSIYWYIVPEDGGEPAEEDLHLLLSNDPDNPAPDVPDTVRIGVDEQIGFALINETGGVHPYGKNSYGDHVHSVHKFYSHLEPENLHSSGYPDCTQGTVQHAWDDNGGSSDDNDHNDAVYDFSCTSVQTEPTSVVLIR